MTTSAIRGHSAHPACLATMDQGELAPGADDEREHE